MNFKFKKKGVPKLNLNGIGNISFNRKIRKISDIGRPQLTIQTDRCLSTKRKLIYEPYLSPNKEFFIEILRKLETFDFTINMNRVLNSDSKDSLQIELFQRQSLSELDFRESNHKEFVLRCGNENFEMVKEVYLMYRSQRLGMQKRDLLSLVKDFDILKKTQQKMAEIEVMFSKFSKNKSLMLKGLIEIFYQLNKIQKNNGSKEFKTFFREILHPKYNEYRLKKAELNIEKIFVFNKNQSQLDENMILLMILDFKDVITHVFGNHFFICKIIFLFLQFFYLFSKNDIRLLDERFIDEKSLLNFCKTYNIIPGICNSSQVLNV